MVEVMILGGFQSRFRILAALVLVASLLTACGASTGGPGTAGLSAAPESYGATVQSAVPTAAGTATAYRLGSGDKVKVNVFGEADLSGEFLVGDNGRIDLPLIGAVQARGQTVTQFQNAVVARYSAGYLRDPKVSVSVLNYRPFFIQGEVGKGGEYPYKAGLTVQDAVAIAGGYTYRANTGKAFVRRAGQDREVEIQTNQRVAINPGDIIRIPERFF